MVIITMAIFANIPLFIWSSKNCDIIYLKKLSGILFSGCMTQYFILSIEIRFKTLMIICSLAGRNAEIVFLLNTSAIEAGCSFSPFICR